MTENINFPHAKTISRDLPYRSRPYVTSPYYLHYYNITADVTQLDMNE